VTTFIPGLDESSEGMFVQAEMVRAETLEERLSRQGFTEEQINRCLREPEEYAGRRAN
jgi:hypothetical protein